MSVLQSTPTEHGEGSEGTAVLRTSLPEHGIQKNKIFIAKHLFVREVSFFAAY